MNHGTRGGGGEMRTFMFGTGGKNGRYFCVFSFKRDVKVLIVDARRLIVELFFFNKRKLKKK